MKVFVASKTTKINKNQYFCSINVYIIIATRHSYLDYWNIRTFFIIYKKVINKKEYFKKNNKIGTIKFV